MKMQWLFRAVDLFRVWLLSEVCWWGRSYSLVRVVRGIFMLGTGTRPKK